MIRLYASVSRTQRKLDSQFFFWATTNRLYHYEPLFFFILEQNQKGTSWNETETGTKSFRSDTLAWMHLQSLWEGPCTVANPPRLATAHCASGMGLGDVRERRHIHAGDDIRTVPVLVADSATWTWSGAHGDSPCVLVPALGPSNFLLP